MANDAQVIADKAAQIIRARLTELLSPRWTPRPHQVPPPGDWYGWLLLAGRGAGKTDACAKYISDHVKGPPCLPGKTPHWIGIIAPTLGDAATSCVTGPSGILAHDPHARMVTVQGGTVVRWPNGSEAKLFGANSLDDTERLRSGGNRSILEGTLIHTDRGRVPIEQVTTEDRVWTRNGLRPVLWSSSHGTRPIWTLRTRSGRSLKLTPDHKVWTDRGWVRCDHLSVGDTLSLWNGAVTAGRDLVRTGHDQCVSGTGTGRSCCTGQSTNSIMDRSRTGGTSTTKTTTSPITTRGTLWPSRPGAITGSIPSRPSGTLPEAGSRSGTRSRTAPVTSAGPSSTDTGTPGSVIGAVGVPSNVRQPPACSHVSCAEAISRCLGGRSPSRVPDAVEIISPGNVVGPVWDLTVAGEHEFFADDLLVSNCTNWLEEIAAWRFMDDAWDQMRFGLRTGPHPRWVGSTTPKPRGLIKRLDRGEYRNVVVTRATTYDNPHLPQEIRDALEETYKNTRKGDQELLGLIMEEDENALWSRAMIDAARTDPSDLPPMVKITVGVDPSGGAGEQGIVVGGKSRLWTPTEGGKKFAHGFVLDDRTCHLKPEGWGARAVQAAVDWEADDITVETNYGRDMAVSTIRTAAELMGVPIPITVVHASRGKRVRAEPVSALTQQGRWRFGGRFEQLEDQLSTWTPELDWSPDRLDAMVWDAVGLGIAHMHSAGTGRIGGTGMSRVIG